MHGGVANVYFKRAFAATIDQNDAYYGFLTPLGDTRPLRERQNASRLPSTRSRTRMFDA